MYDRIPSPGKENRVSITQDNGQVITGVLAYADDATQEGSAYTKGNVLPDSVLSLIGLPTESSEPADMFNVLATVGDLYVWRRTVNSPDGKPEVPAGYTLGAVQSGSFRVTGFNASYTINWTGSETVEVSNDGTISLSGSVVGINISGADGLSSIESKMAKIAGKFVRVNTSGTYFQTGVIYFFPADVSVSETTVNDGQTIAYVIDKYQTVTGYPYQPAVPPGTVTVDYPVSVNPNAYQTGTVAGTTIEYLGKLGDKARIVTGSYVGTGTYGSSNQNKLEFESEPKVVFISMDAVGQTMYGVSTFLQGVSCAITVTGGLSNAESSARNIEGGGVSVSWEGKTMKFYNALSSELQLNKSGTTYKYRAIL